MNQTRERPSGFANRSAVFGFGSKPFQSTELIQINQREPAWR